MVDRGFPQGCMYTLIVYTWRLISKGKIEKASAKQKIKGKDWQKIMQVLYTLKWEVTTGITAPNVSIQFCVINCDFVVQY